MIFRNNMCPFFSFSFHFYSRIAPSPTSTRHSTHLEKEGSQPLADPKGSPRDSINEQTVSALVQSNSDARSGIKILICVLKGVQYSFKCTWHLTPGAFRCCSQMSWRRTGGWRWGLYSLGPALKSPIGTSLKLLSNTESLMEILKSSQSSVCNFKEIPQQHYSIVSANLRKCSMAPCKLTRFCEMVKLNVSCSRAHLNVIPGQGGGGLIGWERIGLWCVLSDLQLRRARG